MYLRFADVSRRPTGLVVVGFMSFICSIAFGPICPAQGRDTAESNETAVNWEQTLAEAVADSLKRARKGGEGPGGVGRLFGDQSFWIPFLMPHLKDSEQGILALETAATLPGMNRATLVMGLVDAQRTDPGFIQAAARVLRNLPNSGGAPTSSKALRAHASECVRLVALEATAAQLPGAEALVDSLAKGSDAEAKVALRHLKTSHVRRRALTTELTNGGLRGERARWVWAELLREGSIESVPALLQFAMQEEGSGEMLRKEAISGSMRTALVAEALSVEESPKVNQVIAGCLQMPKASPREQLLGAMTGRLGAFDACALAARRPALQNTARGVARALLPDFGVVIEDPKRLLELADKALPVHIPYLLANSGRLSPVQQIQVAVALQRLKHPRGAADMARLFKDQDPQVRAGALKVLAKDPTNAKLAMSGLTDDSEAVRWAALEAVESNEMAIDPTLALQLINEREPPETDFILAALARHPRASRARSGLLKALEQGEITDEESVAAYLFAPERNPPAPLSRRSLSHPSPSVQAWAVTALARGKVSISLLREWEPLMKSPHFQVRVHVARAIGKVKHDLSRTSLVLLTKDSSEWVREEAYLGLAHQGRYHVIPVLRRGLRDESARVRNAAAIACLAHGAFDVGLVLVEGLGVAAMRARTVRAFQGATGLKSASAEEWEAALEAKSGRD